MADSGAPKIENRAVQTAKSSLTTTPVAASTTATCTMSIPYLPDQTKHFPPL
jgi:hypothetical protein